MLSCTALFQDRYFALHCTIGDGKEKFACERRRVSYTAGGTSFALVAQLERIWGDICLRGNGQCDMGVGELCKVSGAGELAVVLFIVVSYSGCANGVNEDD